MAETPNPIPTTTSPLKSSIGSVLSMVFIALIPIVAVTFIAMILAQSDLIRSGYGAGGGNTAGLDLVESNVTLYVTFYYPGNGNQSVEGNCQTATGEDNGPRGHYFYRNTNTAEMINYCNASSEDRASMLNDNKYELVSIFSADKTWFAKGGIAVNNPSWPNGTVFPIAGRVKQVRSGTTYWLQIPGLGDLVPVIDHFGTATATNHSAQQRMLATGRDMRYRIDFAIKATDGDTASITTYENMMGCKSSASGGPYSCEVSGVNAYYGNPFVNKGNGSTEDIVRVALSQKGIKEEGGNRGPQIDKYFVPQGAQGQLSPSQGQPWCAYFATWVLDQAGVKITRQGNVGALKDEIVEKFKFFERGTEPPQPGDVFFENGYSHTGIVVEVNGDTLKVIEGNTSSEQVSYNTSDVSRFESFGRVVK